MGVRVPAMSFSIESIGCLAGIAFLVVGALQDAAARLGFVETSNPAASIVGCGFFLASVVMMLCRRAEPAAR